MQIQGLNAGNGFGSFNIAGTDKELNLMTFGRFLVTALGGQLFELDFKFLNAALWRSASVFRCSSARPSARPSSRSSIFS